VYGEGMDSGDKAYNKAMSIGLKYACFQTFMIPTASVDPDGDTPPPTAPPAQTVPPEDTTELREKLTALLMQAKQDALITAEERDKAALHANDLGGSELDAYVAKVENRLATLRAKKTAEKVFTDDIPYEKEEKEPEDLF